MRGLDDPHDQVLGSNRFGKLGSPSVTTDYSPTPVDVAGVEPHDFDTIGLGLEHACAIRGQAEVMCWGSNYPANSVITATTTTSPSRRGR